MAAETAAPPKNPDYLTQARAILEYYLADNTPDLQFRRGLDGNKTDAALALVDKYSALHTADKQARAWAALAYICEGSADDALREIETALDAGLTGAAWLDLAGDIEYARGDLSAALDYYSRAAAQHKDPWHQWDVARTLSEVGDKAAPAAWDKLTADYPTSVSAWLEHGWHAYDQKDYATAKADYAKAINLKDNAEAHNRLGILLTATGDGAGAEAEYRKAIALEATPQLYANLIELMQGRNAPPAELEPVYNELLTKFPDDQFAQRVNGDRLLAAHNPQAALAAYLRSGQDAYTLNAMGNCLFALKRYPEAEADYRSALDAGGFDPVVVGNIAGALRAQGKADDERKLWEKYVALHGDDGAMHLGYGNALFAQGQYSDALEQYKRAGQNGANTADVHNQSGLALMQLGKPADAAEEFKAAAALDPQTIYFGNAGYAYGQAGQWADAEAQYRAGLAKFPNDADLSSGLGEALAAQGHSGEAASTVLAAAQDSGSGNSDNAGTGVSLSAVGTPIRASENDPTPNNTNPPVVEQKSEEQIQDPVEANPVEHMQSADTLTRVPMAEALTEVPTAPDPGTQAKLYAEAAHHATDAGNVEQAIDAYQHSFDAQPDLDVAADWALLLAQQKRGEQLITLVSNVKTKLGAESSDKLTDRLGRYYLEGQDYPGGTDLMQRLIAADPRSAMPYNQLALIQAAQHDPQSALATVKRGLNDAGDNYIGRYLEASFTAAVSGPEAALPLAREVALQPEVERNGYMLYLKLLDTEGNYGEEAEVGRKAYAQNPGNGPIFGHLARALYFSGDDQGAVDLLEDPANAKVDYPARYEILGNAYLDMGNYVKAAAYLNQALAIHPDSADLLAALGQAQHFLGNENDARTSLGRALNLDPGLPAAHLWQGWVQAQAGASADASQNFSAVEANPLSEKDELAWAALGRALLHINAGDSAGAKVLADKAAAFDVKTDAFNSELDQVRSKL